MKSAWKISFMCLLTLLALCFGMVAASAEGTITLPAGLQVIEEEAFLNASGMRHVVIPDGAKEIGPRAFAGASVKSMVIPASVTVIAEDAFRDVTGLTVVGKEGSYAQTYCEAHGIAFTTRLAEPWPESPHPCEPNMDRTWTWTGNEETQLLRITFSSETAVDWYDRVYIYNGSGKKIGEYSGYELSSKTVSVLGNAFSIRLVTDSSGQHYGFAIDSIEEVTDFTYQPVTIKAVQTPASTVPVHSDVTWTVETEGNFGPFTYEYKLMYETWTYGWRVLEEPMVTFKVWDDPGTFVLHVTVRDAAGGTATAVSEPVTAVPRPLTIESITANAASVEVGEEITWHVVCQNGAGSLTMDYVLMKDGQEVHRQMDTWRTSYQYLPVETGIYTLMVTVTDEDGATQHATAEPVTATEPTATPAELFTYIINEENQAIITSYTGEKMFVVIPETLGGVPVVGIGEEAFTELFGSKYYGNKYLRSIKIPDCVKTIGENAFRECENLEKVDLGYGIRRIEATAFYGCIKLERMDFPPRVEFLGGGALAGCTSLTAITYPAELVKVDGWHGVFSGCTSLKKIKVPEGVTALPDYVFRNAPALETVELPWTLMSVGEYAFSDCTNLKQIELPDRVTEIGSYAFKNCTALKTFRFPSDWRGDRNGSGGRFSGCTDLTIILPEGITKLEESLFYDTAAMVEIYLPASLETIGRSTFEHCTNLTTVHFSEGLKQLEPAAFRDCTSLKEINLPDSVEIIEWSAFENCTSLEKFHYPLSWKKSSFDVFINCPRLKIIEIQEGVTAIPSSAFIDASSIEEVYLPASLREIGENAFRGCTSLKDVHFNEGLLKIGGRAFKGCTSLKDADLPDSVRHIQAGVFSDCRSLESFHYPLSWESTFVSDEGNGQIVYGANQVGGCPKLTKIVVPEGITTLPEFIFAECSNLQEVVLPNSLVEIRYGAFKNCKALRKVNIPGSVLFIGKEAFANCGTLKVSCEWGTEGYLFAQKNNINHEYLTAHGIYAPEGKLLLGEDFDFLGYVRANDTIRSLSASIYNSDGTKILQGTISTPNDTVVELVTAINDKLDFSVLPEGRYLFRMTAVVADKREQTIVESTFDIVPRATFIRSSGITTPTGLYTEGDQFTFKGSVTFKMDDPEYALPVKGVLSVRIIRETDNSIVRTYTFAADSGTFDIADVQEAMRFNELKAGMYAYRITAQLDGVPTMVADSHFRIASEEENLVRAAALEAAWRTSSSKINNDLLYESAVMSNMAYSVSRAKAYLKSLGFQKISDYSITPGTHTIGHFIGWKDMLDEDGTVTRVFAIICRGTKIDSPDEWRSNFTFATPNGYHLGFYQAAQEVKQHFLEYIKEYMPAGGRRKDVKVWITGHSRGGAVANMLGGAFLVNEGFSRTNVFTYTFACPNVCIGDTSGATNVFNYNIAGDFVPRVPLDDWGFSRYGYTRTLRNDDREFGVSLTDAMTMDRLEDWIAEIERLETFQQVWTKSLQGIEIYAYDKMLLTLIGAAIEVGDAVEDDKLLWKDAAELFKDAGATHNSTTYIKWISSITGR